MTNIDKPYKVAELGIFLKEFRESIKNSKGIKFVDHDMCVLNEKYHIKIKDGDIIEIRKEGLIISVSNENSNYYHALYSLLDDIYFNRKDKEEYLRKINSFIKRVAKEYADKLSKMKEKSILSA